MRRALALLGARLLAGDCASAVTSPRADGPPVVLMMASTIGPIDAGTSAPSRTPTGARPVSTSATRGRDRGGARHGQERELRPGDGPRALEDLLNHIAVIRVNPARFPRVNTIEAEWRRRHPAG